MADLVKTHESTPDVWPALPLDEWAETYATLHRWTQVIGKIRLARAPFINHWWQVPLYVTARGMTTSPIPDGGRTFQIDFDFLDHCLLLQTSTGGRGRVELASRSVADFYRTVMSELHALGTRVQIWTRPVEIENPIPFEQDEQHATYNPEQATRFWRVLVQADRVLTEFRSRFIGKCSPVHFFWGSFDLAVTRFCGRRAPPHPGGIPNLADWVTREAYSRECSSCGFWPGSGAVKEPAFYAYAYPEPDGFKDFQIRPRQAFYSAEMKEFILRYEDVRASDQPERMLLAFLQSTYEAAAERGGWDRENLEKDYPMPGETADADKGAAFPEHHTDNPSASGK
jgi:Family of unknown function (DUF5996)